MSKHVKRWRKYIIGVLCERFNMKKIVLLVNGLFLFDVIIKRKKTGIEEVIEGTT